MDYRKEYEKWLASPALSEDERTELKALEGNDKEIKARFYGPLEFGTAGLRGTMYTGLHNMNRHVIRWATQGFANVIRAEGEEAMKKGVAVCMDCRNHSAEFARETACVMAANGIHVRLFESLRPTPELSFAVREYGCQAGVNATAQPQGVQRLQGLLVRRRTAAAAARCGHCRRADADRHFHGCSVDGLRAGFGRGQDRAARRGLRPPLHGERHGHGQRL